MSTPIQRRDLLGRVASAAGAAVAATLVLGFVPLEESRAEWRPRPPGALDGDRFTAACARCGRCVTACPYDTLYLAAPGDPAPIGTPFFTPRDIPCYMCKDIPCVKACPTGALDPFLDDIRNARMGVAAVDPNSCLSWQGLRCEVCLRECPEANRAITIEMHPRGLSKHAVFVPVVHPDAFKELCDELGLDPEDDASLDAKPVRQAALKRIKLATSGFPNYGVPRQVKLLRDAWTIDNGLLTPTLKLKRNIIRQRYVDEIDALYDLVAK